MSNHPGTARWMELESVLNNLGYQRPEIARAIKKLQDQKPDIDEIPLENLVKMSLGELGRSQRPDLMN
jgi:Holliday junction resolvasome RuvABC DNA-binding subunit